MRREIQIDVLGETATIVQEETRDWWETTEIGLPKTDIAEYGGLWEDDCIFDLKDKYGNSSYRLRIPTLVFLSILAETRRVIDQEDTWWRQDGLKEKFIDALKKKAAPKKK